MYPKEESDIKKREELIKKREELRRAKRASVSDIIKKTKNTQGDPGNSSQR